MGSYSQILRDLQVIRKLLVQSSFSSSISSHYDMIVTTLGKALLDSFPSVKKEAADIVVEISSRSTLAVRLQCKSLLRGLVPNSGHQHSKVRIPSIKV